MAIRELAKVHTSCTPQCTNCATLVQDVGVDMDSPMKCFVSMVQHPKSPHPMICCAVQEAGIDMGGLMKEFLESVVSAGFDPNRGLFAATPDGQAYPNPLAGGPPHAACALLRRSCSAPCCCACVCWQCSTHTLHDGGRRLAHGMHSRLPAATTNPCKLLCCRAAGRRAGGPRDHGPGSGPCPVRRWVLPMGGSIHVLLHACGGAPSVLLCVIVQRCSPAPLLLQACCWTARWRLSLSAGCRCVCWRGWAAFRPSGPVFRMPIPQQQLDPCNRQITCSRMFPCSSALSLQGRWPLFDELQALDPEVYRSLVQVITSSH